MFDRKIQERVLEELDWEPQVRATDVGVSIRDGVVSLTGFVDSFLEKHHAEEAAKRVFGVRAVANELEVKLPFDQARTDGDIAAAAAQALDLHPGVPRNKVRITVADGWVTLEGELEWRHQRSAAEEAIGLIGGVRGIHNRIEVKTHVCAADVSLLIEQALCRSAELDARRIAVKAGDSTVTLTGHVHSLAEREEALAAAWRAPGVKHVEDRLEVVP